MLDSKTVQGFKELKIELINELVKNLNILIGYADDIGIKIVPDDSDDYQIGRVEYKDYADDMHLLTDTL